MKRMLTDAPLLACAFLVGFSSAFVYPATVSFSSNRRGDTLNSRQTCLFFGKPLATEGDWSAYLDEEGTGLIYYFNGKTGDSLWVKPTPTFPDVALEGRLQQKALEKQEEYVRAIEEKEEEEKKKGLLSSLLDAPAEEQAFKESQQRKKKEEKASNAWFTSILDDGLETIQKPSEKKEDMPGLFGGLFDSKPGEGAKKPIESSTTAVDQKKAQERERQKEEKGLFGGLFDSKQIDTPTSDATTTKQEPSKSQETERKKEEAGLFGKFIDAKEKVTSAAATIKAPGPTMTTVTEKPRKKEEKIQVKETVMAPIQIKASSYVLPHPAKVRWGGEDAVFTKGRTFGVFDGVSGAEKQDGVPLYSKTLAEEMKKNVKDDEALTMTDISKRLLYAAEVADESATGASTAIVASISEDGYLRALNVGDSACLVIRNDKVAAKTREISHYFECPYQLSIDSPDRPRDGTKFNVELKRGDLVLMGSDGIFDNLTDEQVVEIVKTESQLARIAKRVSEQSRKVSLDSSAPTPYAKMAKRYGDPDYEDGLGGKVDDVSCIVVSYD